jgi:hypothetical protein
MTGDGSVSARPCTGDINVVPGHFKFDVVPPVFWAEPGATYTVGNRTRYQVDVIFPPEIVGNTTVIPVPPDQCGSFTTRPDGFGVHDYEVVVNFSDREGDSLFASGGSNPRIVFK